MDKERLQIVSTLVITLALLLFAFLLVLEVISLAQESERVSPETIVVGIMGFAQIILVAVVARWLQQGAVQSAEKQAEKLAEGLVTNPPANGGRVE